MIIFDSFNMKPSDVRLDYKPKLTLWQKIIRLFK
jgi:hypothetical protein